MSREKVASPLDKNSTLQVLEECHHEFTDTQFDLAGDVFNTKLFEHVSKRYGRRQRSVEDNFLNVKHGVVFRGDAHRSILLSRYVEKSCIIADEL